MSEAPSPNVQAVAVRVPSGSLEVLVKVHASWVHDVPNDAVGAWFCALTVTGADVVDCAPSSSVTVRVTVRVPAEA